MQKKLEKLMAKSSACKLKELLSPRFFKALGDPTRIAILQKLVDCKKECTVSQIAESCSVGMSAVSRHLAMLRDSGVLSCERRGQEVYYRVRTHELANLLRRLADALEPGSDSHQKD